MQYVRCTARCSGMTALDAVPLGYKPRVLESLPEKSPQGTIVLSLSATLSCLKFPTMTVASLEIL